MNFIIPAFGLGTTELIIILCIVVIIFGVGKLPSVGKELGRGIKNFKKEINADGEEAEDVDSLPQPRDVTNDQTV